MQQIAAGSAAVIGALFLVAAPTARPTGRDDSPVLTGALADASGAPTSGRIWVFAVVPDLRSGDGAVRAPLLAEAKANKGGRFAATSPAPALALSRSAPKGLVARVLGGIERNGGWANLDVVASDGKVTRLVAASRLPDIGPRGISRFVSGTGTLNVGTISLSRTAPGAVSTTSSIKGSGPTCYESVEAVGPAFSKETVVGELHAAGDASETFGFDGKADSEIDIGVSADSGETWSAGDGSFHIANSVGSGSEWPSQFMNNKRLVTQFQYQRYTHRFFGPGCAGRRTLETVQATSWLGGAYTGSAAPDPSRGCTRTPFSHWTLVYGRGARWHRDHVRAERYGAAATLFGVLRLGATTGYSRTVTLRFTAGTKHKRYLLCGDDGYPRVATRVFSGFSDMP